MNLEGADKFFKAGDFNVAYVAYAAETLRHLIECIGVSYLRGGIKAHMQVEDKYTEWKAL